MQAELAPGPPAWARLIARTVIARRTVRKSVRSAVLWGYVFGITVVSSAVSYAGIYKTAAERRQLEVAFGHNLAAGALFGPARQLQDVAGFTVFKSSMTVMVIGAVWGLLTSTRLLRGEEDAGRWELLASGETDLAGAATQGLCGLAVAACVVWALTAVAVVAVGRWSLHVGAPAAVYFATALTAGAALFLGFGALTSQLAASRRQAASYAGVVLGVSYGLRMVGDAVSGLHWLVWLSPLGWVEQLRPLTAPQPWAFAPIVGATLLSAWAAVCLAGRRDVGGSTLADRSSRVPRLGLLSGPLAFTLRLARPAVTWWACVLAASGVLLGTVAKASGTTIVGSSVRQVFSRLGATGSGAAAFLGVAFVILAMVVAFQAVAHVATARREEVEGRALHLLAGPVSRSGWFGAWLAVATGSLVLSCLVAGAASWAGVALQGARAGFWSVMAAGVNMLAPSIFVMGAGTLAFGVLPRATVPVMYAVLGWSALVDLVAGFTPQSHWVLDTSLFHHMAAAPAVGVDWKADGIVVGAGVLMALVGWRGLLRRDLQLG